MKTSGLILSLSLATAPLLTACSGGGSYSGPGGNGKTGELTVEITDKPFAYDLVTKAVVRVDRIQIQEMSDPDGSFQTLFEGGPIEVDLLDLTNGATQILVRTDVPVGNYDQMRLHVVGGQLELVDGDVFSTELGNLHLTSTGTSGLKILVEPPIQVTSQVSQSLLLDFDLTKSFHAVPGKDPLNATSYKLMPVVHATNRSVTGEIRGVVREDDGSGTGTLVGVAQATVYLMPPGEPDPTNSVAATTTLEDGSYALIGVQPGTWDVLAVLDPKQGRVEGLEVSVGNVTPADVLIE